VTSEGTRDLFFFVSQLPGDEDVDRLIQSVALEVDYRFELLHDPEWRPYRDLVGDPVED
jgi:hypothetical protein